MVSQKYGILKLNDYLKLIRTVRSNNYSIKIKFGLEICYFEKFEQLVSDLTKDTELDFLLGSVHFIDDFAFDHKAEFWEGINVDEAYRRYFERSIHLAQSAIFSGIAHPDCIKLFGLTPSFSLQPYYDNLAKALAKNNMYAEESSGISRRCPETATLGMNSEMLKTMKAHAVKIITVSDAHYPNDVGDKIREMEKLIINYQLDY